MPRSESKPDLEAALRMSDEERAEMPFEDWVNVLAEAMVRGLNEGAMREGTDLPERFKKRDGVVLPREGSQ